MCPTFPPRKRLCYGYSARRLSIFLPRLPLAAPAPGGRLFCSPIGGLAPRRNCSQTSPLHVAGARDREASVGNTRLQLRVGLSPTRRRSPTDRASD